jgi:hypothetical protein
MITQHYMHSAALYMECGHAAVTAGDGWRLQLIYGQLWYQCAIPGFLTSVVTTQLHGNLPDDR